VNDEAKAKNHGDISCVASSDTSGKSSGTHSFGRASPAVIGAFGEVIGVYGIAGICADFPDVIVGIGDGEHFLASDASAVARTPAKSFIQDNDIATITGGSFAATNANVQISQIDFDASAVETCPKKFSSSRARLKTRCVVASTPTPARPSLAA
jgi:hypothetical protein